MRRVEELKLALTRIRKPRKLHNGGRMAGRFGNFLHWCAVIIAVLIGALGCLFLSGNSQGQAVGVFLLIGAGFVYLLGRGVRYVLSGR